MRLRLIVFGGLLLWVGVQAAPAKAQAVSKRVSGPQDLFAQGQLYERKGQLNLAIAKYESALQAYEKLNEPEGIARALVRLGGMEMYARKQAQATEHLNRAISLGQAKHNQQLEAEARIFLGWLLSTKSAQLEAQESFRSALQLCDTRDDELQSHAWTGIGWTHLLTDEREHALQAFRKAISIAEKSGSTLRLGEGWRGVGAALKDQDVTESMVALKRAEALLRQAGNRYYLAQSLHSLGNTHYSLGNYERAIRSFQEASHLKRAIGDRGTSGSLIGMGAAQERLGDYVAAARAYREAERSALASGNRDHVSRTLLNLGALHFRLGNYTKSAEAFQQSAKAAQEIGSEHLAALATSNQALVLAELPNAPMQKEAIAEVVRVAEGSGLPHLIWGARLAVARFEERQGNDEAAEQGYRRVFEVIEHGRYQQPTGAARARYLEEKLLAYEYYLSLLYRRMKDRPEGQEAARAFELAESAKARSLLETLPETQEKLDKRLPGEILDKRQQLLTELSRLQAELVRLTAGSLEHRTVLEKIKKAEDQWDDLVATIRTVEPASAAFTYPQPRAIREIQQILAPKEVFISYLLGERVSFAWAISRETVIMRQLLGQRVIAAEVARFRRLLTAPARQAGDLPDTSKESLRLYHLLLAPFSQQLKQARQLCISPDGTLHYLPFEALKSQSAFVSDRFEVSYVPSASVRVTLAELHQGRPEVRSPELLALGAPEFSFAKASGSPKGGNPLRDFYLERGLNLAPLPFAQTELQSLQRLYGSSKVDVRLGPAAQEAWVKKADLKQYNYIHFATHAFADERLPERSSLVLSMPSGEGEDGLLQVREIMNLKLDADLVVLSGCGTGIGRLVRGEGILGLTQSFFSAGTPSVVASLWAVRDRSTAIFMQQFYKELRAGRTKAQALRLAKLSMLRSDTPAYRHPFYWAAFVLVGNNN